MLAAVNAILPSLPAPEDMVVHSRTLYLPLSWNDPQIQLAMRKYQETTRPNAPWCPDNIEFIRRINGLESIEEVKRIIFDAPMSCSAWAMCISARRSRPPTIRATAW